MSDTERKTPLVDELEKGPWPSFVKEIKSVDNAKARETGLTRFVPKENDNG